jgi:hypothetical protein
MYYDLETVLTDIALTMLDESMNKDTEDKDDTIS